MGSSPIKSSIRSSLQSRATNLFPLYNLTTSGLPQLRWEPHGGFDLCSNLALPKRLRTVSCFFTISFFFKTNFVCMIKKILSLSLRYSGSKPPNQLKTKLEHMSDNTFLISALSFAEKNSRTALCPPFLKSFDLTHFKKQIIGSYKNHY